ncbi:L-serine ammonia-lyase, iron-sulfur-dependent, subunit alpha [Candidatus Dojkabacteria bacterium]|nr:L-serine ammonia-lyase, iron-sulfur-dependent, subunit alpha [Candidatus Dojkabacteria bacterium]
MQHLDFLTTKELLQVCKKHNITIAKATIIKSCNDENLTEKQLIERMEERIEISRNAISDGLKNTKRTKSGLSGGDAKRLDKYESENNLISKALFKAIKYSFSITEQNARFKRIVALPTAGSSGTVPGALIAAQEELGKTEEELINAFFSAGAVGLITAENASISGAAGGCQAEVGTASAMAAAALTEMRGGSPEQAMNAASIALKGLLGLVCDPIAGLVECPCVKRNATGIANAFMASEISLANVKSNVDYDEVLVAMNNVSKHMATELRETAKGGLAITKTGKKVAKLMED